MNARPDPFEAMDRLFEEMRRSMRASMADTDTRGRGRRRPGGGDPGLDRTDDGDRMARRGAGTDRRRTGTTAGTNANLTVEESEDGYVVVADLPGFDAEDLNLRFDDGLLTIDADSDATEASSSGVRRRRRSVSERVRLPGSVVADGITATYRNGVLKVEAPVDDAGGRRIDVD